MLPEGRGKDWKGVKRSERDWNAITRTNLRLPRSSANAKKNKVKPIESQRNSGKPWTGQRLNWPNLDSAHWTKFRIKVRWRKIWKMAKEKEQKSAECGCRTGYPSIISQCRLLLLEVCGTTTSGRQTGEHPGKSKNRKKRKAREKQNSSLTRTIEVVTPRTIPF